MKRLILLVIAAVMAVSFAAPASADIHLVTQCGGQASISLTSPGDGALRYTGKIVGTLSAGAPNDHITITSLDFTPLLPLVPAETNGPLTSTAPGATIQIVKDVAGALPGIYTVAMATDVTCLNGGWHGTPSRNTMYLYLGTLQPIKLA